MSIATPDIDFAGLLAEDSTVPIQVISLTGPIAEAPLWVITKLASKPLSMFVYMLLQLGSYGVDVSHTAMAKRLACTSADIDKAFDELVSDGALCRLGAGRLELILENPDLVARLREVDRHV